MSEIAPEVIDRMMVKCGRRCCICRRFRPTKLQAHHIVERGQGGSDDEDNLIVTCFSCHSDVHTKVPFARRFSVAELKGHRDAVITMVEAGTLPAGDSDDTDEAIAIILREMRAVPKPQIELLPEAVEILTKAVGVEGGMQGMLHFVRHEMWFNLLVGGVDQFSYEDHRQQARYKKALDQLLQCRLVEWRCDQILDVTYAGYLVADEMMSRGPGLLGG
jgi:HNH endonuclease